MLISLGFSILGNKRNSVEREHEIFRLNPSFQNNVQDSLLYKQNKAWEGSSNAARKSYRAYFGGRYKLELAKTSNDHQHELANSRDCNANISARRTQLKIT